MESAFGVEHGDVVQKGLKDAVGTARLYGRAVKQGRKLANSHIKLARAQSGYTNSPTGNIKDSFKAGLKGNAKTYRKGQQMAHQVGRDRAKRDITRIMSGGSAQPSFADRIADASSGKLAQAGFNRRMSEHDYRLGSMKRRGN